MQDHRQLILLLDGMLDELKTSQDKMEMEKGKRKYNFDCSSPILQGHISVLSEIFTILRSFKGEYKVEENIAKEEEKAAAVKREQYEELKLQSAKQHDHLENETCNERCPKPSSIIGDAAVESLASEAPEISSTVPLPTVDQPGNASSGSIQENTKISSSFLFQYQVHIRKRKEPNQQMNNL